MLYLSVSVTFVFFLQIVAHGMLIDPVLGNRGAGSAVLTVANLCVHRFVSLCRAASSLPCDKYQEISQGLFLKKTKLKYFSYWGNKRE